LEIPAFKERGFGPSLLYRIQELICPQKKVKNPLGIPLGVHEKYRYCRPH